MATEEHGVQEKFALITGASSGIGRALALALAQVGTRLILVGRDRAKLAAVAEQAKDPAAAAHPCYACDLADDAQLDALAKTVRHSFQQLDYLVHSAGIFSMGSLSAMPVQEMDQLYRVNLRAPYRLTQELLPLLRASHGQVVFINSTAALQGGANWAAYSAIKAGLKMLADSVRAELDTQGIRVLSVYPGRTATPMQELIFRLEQRDYKPEDLVQPEDIAAQIVNLMQMPRTAEVTDIIIKSTKKVAR